MIKAKHTPGPWKIDYGYNRSINFIGPCVPDQYAGSSWLAVKEADARLIAASPYQPRMGHSSMWCVFGIDSSHSIHAGQKTHMGMGVHRPRDWRKNPATPAEALPALRISK